MKSGLKILVIPTAVLILTLGFMLPVFSTIQTERCNLAFMDIVEADLVHVRTLEQIQADRPDTVAYLMKHPRQTLKNCLAYETENRTSDRLDLISALGSLAYEEIAGTPLISGLQPLKEKLQRQNPKLYDELTAE